MPQILLLLLLSFALHANEEITTIETPIYTNSFEQASVPRPIILNDDDSNHVTGDDRNAIINWNSYGWVNHPNPAYDTEKQLGIYGYLIEWGEVGTGFTKRELTTNRSHQLQPLTPGTLYQARVYAIDAWGELSLPSETVTTSHNDIRVNAMRFRLKGFFDDFNLPAGPFDELKWSQAYSGCVGEGTGGQHINNQFHGHNLLATKGCDRGVAVSRSHAVFDFTDRTGLIEFDLDGASGDRQFWYLDLSPVDPPWGRKRDITGFVSLGQSNDTHAEPPGLLRLVQSGNHVSVQLSDETGVLHTLHDLYRNGACGADLRFCSDDNGQYNLLPQTNVRHHWQINLSQTRLEIFIESILVVDVSLEQLNWTSGLPWGRVQTAWTFFSYNTAKENIVRALLHWDNFGFDAPASAEPAPVVHNYTDGEIGPKTYTTNNCCAPRAQQDQPLVITINIPDAINDTADDPPEKTELMFTMQGFYQWSSDDHILINNQRYDFPEPQAIATEVSENELFGSIIPYSAKLTISADDLVTGDNELQFALDDIAIFNVHLELTYLQPTAPDYTQPIDIFTADAYLPKIMPNPGPIGAGIIIDEIDGVPAYMFDELNDRSYQMNQSVSGMVPFSVRGNSKAQMVAFGKTTGMTHYQLWQDGTPIKTIKTNKNTPVPSFLHTDGLWDTTSLCNGEHTLFVKAFTPDGTPSFYDSFLGHSLMDEHRPVRVTTNNPGNVSCSD